MAGRISGITIEIGGDTTKLQTALKGVDGQLKQTQTALKDINKLLKLNPANTELLTQKQKNLEKAIQQTKDRLKQLKDAQKGVAQGSAEWDALQREIIDTETKLKGLEKEYRQFGSVGAQQIAAAGKAMQDFGAKCQDAANKMKPISAAAGAIAAGMVGLGVKSVRAADDLNTLSKQSGISTDTLQKMQYAADLIDVPFENISGAVTKMKKSMAGSGKPFEELGVSVTDAEGNMRDAESVFFDTIQALSEIPNEVERDQKAYEIFGKSADELAGIVDDGGKALKAYGKEAEDLGLILSGETLDAMNETNDALDKSKAQLKAAVMQLGGTIASGLAPVVENLSKLVERFIGWLQKLTPEQTNIIMTIALVVAAIAPLIKVVSVLGGLIGGILRLAPAIVSAFTFLLSPIGLVIAAIAALIAIGVALYTHWDEVKAWAIQTWENIKLAVTTAIDKARAKIEEWIISTGEKMTEFVNTVRTKIEEFATQIGDWIDTNLVQPALNAIKEFVNVGRMVVDNIKTGISNAWGALTSWFNGIWSSLFSNRSVDVTVNAQEGGGYATGLDYVPYNGFPAILHRGEAVLTAGEAQHWRDGGTGSIDYDRLAAAIASRPIVIEGDTNRIFKLVQKTNNVRTRATNYNALAMG